ncbi:Acid phosphatase precursor [Penicillium atrosanguineum]|uniref:Acid phosphatase n=1 Tax=Penicillium atrosanguineum TaxID=1132637 RepID=A0A9W9KTL0_9EURO|nr:uncharacterized protein N7443_007144 [Penicillium atrosanguineum]KAJ5118214.1 Acid phosphatase precursor [Penicillium atrosanguineum]KAJ5119259.1 Acid phosphatase precursor [Penicillium atrosanguineum]KAJ5296251.1 hypothetical protein N7443_007144 [Penicillium atrosanguineum]KAJ5299022.1 Acid phosphatase precursor [Penicillium atrosanguineum]
MRVNPATALVASLAFGPASAINIISSNDDGWAEVNIRTLFQTLTDGGHSVVVSAPAEDESGTGQLHASPAPHLLHPTDRTRDRCRLISKDPDCPH